MKKSNSNNNEKEKTPKFINNWSSDYRNDGKQKLINLESSSSLLIVYIQSIMEHLRHLRFLFSNKRKVKYQ
ncbi:hypothetical protein DERP_013599 [Dermatophagoides pteronyssinus]|uniref:Uncharacterized protein n=1 Tax=Dermatophagoides pteronyssinus TaxID=6956 RepID=A0ABQ8IPL6_DERPT|nr:hypothetical protein DERP_013599 [Dermatophagoides pteronyssinus]